MTLGGVFWSCPTCKGIRSATDGESCASCGDCSSWPRPEIQCDGYHSVTLTPVTDYGRSIGPDLVDAYYVVRVIDVMRVGLGLTRIQFLDLVEGLVEEHLADVRVTVVDPSKSEGDAGGP